MDKSERYEYEIIILVETIYGDNMSQELCIEELMNGLNIGIIAIDHLVDKINNDQLRDIVINQRKNYADLLEKIQRHYPDIDNETKSTFMMESMIKMKTILTDDFKISKMLIEGCNQAIMTMQHLMNKVENMEPTLISCIHDFEDISKRYIEDLKSFL